MLTIKDITHLVVPENESDNVIIRRIREAIPGSTVITYADASEINKIEQNLKAQKAESKKVIIAESFKGRLIQKCPGSAGVVCCGYMLINTGFNCIYDCSYCFLNSYLNSYGIKVFINSHDILKQVDEWLSDVRKDKVIRIGTGEFTDSLMIDEFTRLSELFIEKLAPYNNIFLEIKTKSSNVDHLLDIEKKGCAVIAWSVNTQRNIDHHEPGTASFAERITAAAKASQHGYFVAFHFDPVVMYEGWEDEYLKVLQMIYSSVDENKIIWMSIGGIRFTSEYKDTVKAKGLNDEFILQEMILSNDGKMRYFRPFRRKIYDMFKAYIDKKAVRPFLYMCMENSLMWEDVFGVDDYSSEKLEADFGVYLERFRNK